MAKIWSELWESILQLFLVHQFHPFGIECGKAGSIGDERTAAKTVEFDMARGVAAAAKLFRNCGQARLRRLDFPTPELPVKQESFPLSASRRASIPSPVSALVTSTGTPALR